MSNNTTDYEMIDESESKRKTKRLLSSDGLQKAGSFIGTGAGTGSPGGTSALGATKKQKRGKQFRDQNAPRMPLNGYVRYLNSNRDRVKTANPNQSFADVTKLLAVEWSALAPEQKRQYLEEAEKAKELYLKELSEYQRTEAYQEFKQKQNQRKNEQKLKSTASARRDSCGKPSTSSAGPMTGSNAHNINANDANDGLESMLSMDTNSGSTLDLPIFSEEFLDHNRVREQELRSLRRLNTEYEEQNAILSKHIDNMKSAVEKLEVESVQQRHNNQALSQHLQHLRALLLRSFHVIPIPGSNETPSPDNIDEYMMRLQSKLMAKDRTHESEALYYRVRAIVAKLDYNLN